MTFERESGRAIAMLSGKVVARVVRHGEAEVVHLYDVHCPSMAFPAKTDSQRILDAAMILLAREGLRGMSLRAVAVSLKIAPNVIYRYFRDHAHLEAAVGAEVCRRLHAVLRKAAHGREPEAAARATAKAYLKFARDNALLYEALLIPRPASGDEAATPSSSGCSSSARLLVSPVKPGLPKLPSRYGLFCTGSRHCNPRSFSATRNQLPASTSD
jgi:hypothetical protein